MAEPNYPEPPAEKAKKPYIVLVLPGGGVRGIITASFLAQLEKDTGHPISHSMDFIGATSTGGILGLGLSTPHPDDKTRPLYTAPEMLQFYISESPRIFPNRLKESLKWFAATASLGFKPLHALFNRFAETMGDSSLAEPVQHLPQLFDKPSMSQEPLLRIFRERFGHANLSEALTSIMIPAVDLLSKRPLFLRHVKDAMEFGRRDPDFNVAEAIIGFTAAQIWLPAHRVTTIPTRDAPEIREYLMSDGGLFANNPGRSARRDALRILEERGLEDEVELIIVRVGTGYFEPQFDGEKLGKSGIYSYASPSNGIPIRHLGEVAQNTETDRQLSDDFGDNYFVFDIRLDKAGYGEDAPSESIIDASQDNIRRLVKAGERLVTDTPENYLNPELHPQALAEARHRRARYEELVDLIKVKFGEPPNKPRWVRRYPRDIKRIQGDFNVKPKPPSPS